MKNKNHLFISTLIIFVFLTVNAIATKANCSNALIQRLSKNDTTPAMQNKGGNKSLGLNWKSLGPNNVGNPIKDILIDKFNPKKLYAAAECGGLWISTDAGNTWKKHPQNDAFESMCVTALAQSKNGDIYFGTGALITNNYWFQSNGGILGSLGTPGYGLYKSTDGGNTFVHLQSTTPSSIYYQNPWLYIEAIACDNLDNDLIYVATQKGLYKTTDGGGSFSQPTGATSPIWCTDVKVASNGNVITFFGNPMNGPNSKASISIDHGASFNPSGFINNFTTFQKVKFAIAPSNPNVIYAGAIKYGSGSNAGSNTGGGVFRTNDGGQTWIQVGLGTTPTFDVYDFGIFCMGIAVKPDDENIIYTGSKNLWKYNHSNGAWTKINSTDPSNTSYIHPYIFCATFDLTNANKLYLGTEGGLFKSAVAQLAYPSFTEQNGGFCTAYCYGLGLGTDGSYVVGTHYNGDMYNNYTYGNYNIAKKINNKIGNKCAISKLNSQYVFITSYGSPTTKYTLQRSANHGANFSSFLDNHIDANSNDEPDDDGPYFSKIYLWEN